jgi:putative PIN family toxin of toxin-antitoxin system
MGKEQVKRVVIDTNVIVSALLFGGLPGNLIPLWKDGTIQPLCSKDIMDEYLRVFTYPKFKLTEKEINFILFHEILPWFHIVTVQDGRNFIQNDPKDDMFIWCAMEGNASVIISGDEHLLNFKESPVPILSVSKFLKK